MISQVQKEWHKIISEQYSTSIYGRMLRFERFLLLSLSQINDELERLEKKTYHTLTSYLRTHPLTQLYIFSFLVLLIAGSFVLFANQSIVNETVSLRPFKNPGLREKVLKNKIADRVSIMGQRLEGLVGELPEWLLLFAVRVHQHPEAVLFLSAFIMLGYIGHVKYSDYHYQHQPVNATPINNEITHFFSANGRVISNLLHNSNTTQYPPLQLQPNLSIKDFRNEILKDRKKLEELPVQLSQYVETLRFSTRQEVKLSGVPTDNINFKKYLQEKLIFWNNANQNHSNNKIQFESLEKAEDLGCKKNN